MTRYLSLLLLMLFANQLQAQVKKITYHPCFLTDSVEKRLDFIQRNATRIFTDTAECKQSLFDSIAGRYLQTKQLRYLDALSVIRQNPSAKTEDLYTDVIKRFVENDFTGFIQQLYLAKGKYLPLEKELVVTMNMIVGGRPLRQKYLGLLNVEIEKAKDKKDKYKQLYLEKLKVNIEEDKH